MVGQSHWHHQASLDYPLPCRACMTSQCITSWGLSSNGITSLCPTSWHTPSTRRDPPKDPLQKQYRYYRELLNPLQEALDHFTVYPPTGPAEGGPGALQLVLYNPVTIHLTTYNATTVHIHSWCWLVLIVSYPTCRVRKWSRQPHELNRACLFAKLYYIICTSGDLGPTVKKQSHNALN